MGYYFSTIKKRMKSCNDICNDMDRAREYYTKRNKSEKDKYHMISLMEFKNKT